MTRRLMALATVVLVASLAACGGVQSTASIDPTSEASPAADAALFHAIPADSVYVSGTAGCNFLPGPADGAGYGWTAYCELDMSDPRVSGSERHDEFHFIVESKQPAGVVWVADDCSIRNAEASWRGTCQGTDDWDVGGTNLECHYIGEGAYEGLEFHSYVGAQSDGSIKVLGWISGGG